MIELQENNKIKLFSLHFLKLFTLGFVSILAFTILYNYLVNPISQNAQNMTVVTLSTFRIMRLLFLTPLIEELIFRVGIQNLFSRLSKSNVVAILFTSLIFAYVHNDTIFLPYFFNSLVYGLLYVKGGRSIKLPLLLHISNNLLSFLV